MQDLLPYTITALSIWAAVSVWQVRRLTVRYEQVRRSNIEQDRPVRG